MRFLLVVSAGAIVVALVLPTAASAQRSGSRHHDRHHDDKSVDRSGVTRDVAVQPTAVREVVIGQPVVVRQPIVAGWGTQVTSSGFGTMPVRTGFGTLPVRTGFETAPVRTGVETHIGPTPVAATSAGQQGFRSKAFHRHKQRTGVIIVGYPVPYPYAYLPQSGVTTSSAGIFIPPLPHRNPVFPGNPVPGAAGVSAGLSTYWMDLSSETGASSGLSFNVRPAATQVYVDGSYLGTVQDFSTDGQPLLVVPGNHRLELRAGGYRTITLDITLAAGQVIPYEGALEQLRPY